MSQMVGFIGKGGLVQVALVVLALLLYERCFRLILRLSRWRKTMRADDSDASRAASADEMEGGFERQLATIRTLTVAAPLLGLLGTVVGMLQMFASITTRAGERSMQGLADGISMALITTETGLAVAIPALLLVSWAERQLSKGMAEATR
jgi:biopolymer transport protein ExbB/TolQ